MHYQYSNQKVSFLKGLAHMKGLRNRVARMCVEQLFHAQMKGKKNSKTFIVHLLQGYPTLFLESYRPADFSSNPAPTHLSEINKQPWRPLLAGSGVFDWGWSWNLQDGISAWLETPDLLYDHSCCLAVLKRKKKNNWRHKQKSRAERVLGMPKLKEHKEAERLQRGWVHWN